MTTASRKKPKLKSHRQRVRDQIQEQIVSGERGPDERLVQQDLATLFGVSQSVVREALIDLQFSGLVRSVKNLGVFVNKIGIEEILEAWEIREVLEGLAARRCCSQASRVDMARLHEINDEMYRFGQAGDVKQRGVLDQSFHYESIVISNNDVLHRLTDGYRLLGMAVQARRDVEVVYQEHRRILEAIEANDPDAAEQLAREHVRSSREALKQASLEGRFQSDWVVNAVAGESVQGANRTRHSGDTLDEALPRPDDAV